MKRIKLYLDTSVLGGLFDTEDTQRVLTVERLLKSIKDEIYEGFVSPLTIEEILKAPKEITEQLTNRIADARLVILEESEESISLANAYVSSDAIPVKFRNDARHIAIGVCNEINYIVSWNYKHMVNISVRRLVNSTNLKMGYSPIEIISPEEVLGDGEVEI